MRKEGRREGRTVREPSAGAGKVESSLFRSPALRLASFRPSSFPLPWSLEFSTWSARLRRTAAGLAIALTAGLAQGVRADGSLADRIAAAVASGAREFVVPAGTNVLPRGLLFHGVTNFTLRGEPGAVLALPPAAFAIVSEAVPAGAAAIPVSWTRALEPGMKLEIHAPGPIEPHTGRPRPTFVAPMDRAGDGRLVMAGPLPYPVPAGTLIRDANAPNLIDIRGGGDLTIEDLELDGGRRPGDPPHQGHARLCGIFAEGPFGYAQGPTGPPVRRLAVRRCRIRDCFGRGVAAYSVEDAVLECCTISDCADEGLDLDHFAVRCRVVSNRVNRCRVGIELNDTTGCLVALNDFVECDMGLTLWRWCRQPGLNTGNVIESNRFTCITGDAIRLAAATSGNVVRANSVAGAGGAGISVAGTDQSVEDNRIDVAPARRLVVTEGPHRIRDAGDGCAAVLRELPPLSVRGVNYFPRETPWSGAWTRTPPAVWERDMALAASLGINTVRTFLQVSPRMVEAGLVRPDGAIPPAYLARVDTFLAAAWRNGIRAILCFEFDTPWLADTNTAAPWRRAMTAIARAHRDDGRVLLWDLKNEPDDDAKWTPGTRAYLRDAPAVLRAADASHPTTVGITWRIDRLREVGLPDILQYHEYAPKDRLFADGAPRVLRSIANQRAGNGPRPLLVGEFGMCTARDPLHGADPALIPKLGDAAGTEAEQDRLYGILLAAAEEARVAGVLAWCLHDYPIGNPNESHFGLVRADGSLKPAAARLKEAYAQWAARAP